MNNQQARICALLEDAADDFAALEAVPIDTQMKLDAEGYQLSRLDRDINRILSDR